MNYHTDEDLGGYCGDLSPMMAALARKALNRVYRLKDNRVISAKQHISEMVHQGDIRFKILESPRIQPMSNKKYFRATNEEQAAHEKRIKEGGTKKTYLVNNYDYGKTGYDYAKYLQSKVGQSATKPTWQMTKKEYANSGNELSEAYHRNAIVVAIRNGEPVPENVLRDYPDLI